MSRDEQLPPEWTAAGRLGVTLKDLQRRLDALEDEVALQQRLAALEAAIAEIQADLRLLHASVDELLSSQA